MSATGTGPAVAAIRVVVTKGPDQGLTKTAADTLTIGTAATNDLVLTDETVSRFHLELTRAGHEISAVDLGSTNGIITGSARIERAWLGPGATLKLGRTTIRVEDGGDVKLDLHRDESFGGIVGKSEPMRSLMSRVERAADSDRPVLILGETGSGKEVIARTIHQAGARRDMPFEVVDCGAVTPTLLASELFGHEKGAFTGADSRREGAFERAAGGTLFLDEIGELPLALQTSLLGVLERREFRRVGGEALIPMEARILSATHRDLRKGVNDGSFRSDLYYRIAVVLLRVPALRDRKSDIPLLIESFARESGLTGSLESVLPPEVVEEMMLHSWPGNVRELRNAVDAAVVMGETPELVDDPGDPEDAGDASISIRRLLRLPYPEARDGALEAFEEVYLKELLERCDGSVTEAARRAQVHRTYLSRLIKRRGIRFRRTMD